MAKKNKNLVLYEMKKINPTTAVLFSLLITGSGSMYAGKVGKGFAVLFTQIALWMILMGWIMWIIAPIIAYHDAIEYNKLLALELDIEV